MSESKDDPEYGRLLHLQELANQLHEELRTVNQEIDYLWLKRKQRIEEGERSCPTKAQD